SSRSRVRRFPHTPSQAPPAGGFTWSSGEVWADGTRNPLALSFDTRSRLWEFDNGPDDLDRLDLTSTDIHNDNPCEELNLLNGPVNTHYGYPNCFSIGNLTLPFTEDPRHLEQY